MGIMLSNASLSSRLLSNSLLNMKIQNGGSLGKEEVEFNFECFLQGKGNCKHLTHSSEIPPTAASLNATHLRKTETIGKVVYMKISPSVEISRIHRL